MSFKSFLSAVGHDAVGVIKYLGSAQGQKNVQIAEAAAVTIGTAVGGPGLGAGIAAIELLVNKGITAAFSMEATAAALNAQSGTGLQKGAAVAASLEPQAEQLLKDLGYENPTVEQIELIASTVSKSLADIFNTVPPPAALAAPASPTSGASAPIPIAASSGMTVGR